LAFQAPVLSCPTEIRGLADQFSDVVGSHYKSFVAALCGAVFGSASFSDVSRYFTFSPSVSELGRLYDDPEIHPKLNRRHRRRVQSLLTKAKKDPDRYMWAIDDTIAPHWGKQIWGAHRWYDHSKGATVLGHKILVLGLVDRRRKLLIPVFWEILHREVPDFEDRHEKGWEVAVKLLKSAQQEGFPRLTVCADSWFAGEDFFDALSKLKLNYVIEIKSNRTVVGTTKATGISMRVDDFFRNRKRKKIFYKRSKKWASSKILDFKDAKRSYKTVAVANNKKLENECFAYYVSNQLTWDAAAIWAVSRDRWAIEVQFRELKQSFTLGESAVRSKQAVETSITIAMIALTFIRLEQLARVDASEDQYVRPIPAGNIVREYQLQSLICSISKLASTGHVAAKKKLALRMNRENLSQKPTEKHRPEEIYVQRGSRRKAA
jgi:SRSO17 transposase